MRFGDKKLEAVRAALELLARVPGAEARKGLKQRDIDGALEDVRREQERRAKGRAERSRLPRFHVVEVSEGKMFGHTDVACSGDCSLSPVSFIGTTTEIPDGKPAGVFLTTVAV